jgi:hypothetical protein
VIEPAAGATRATLAFLYDAYRVEEAPDADGKMQSRTVLKLDKRLAPYKVAVLPLSKKDTLTPVAKEVFDLCKVHWMTEYDETQSIGRRYRRQDEIGTPYCVTVDFDTLEDRAVTVRDRDTMTQDRVSIDRLLTSVEPLVAGVLALLCGSPPGVPRASVAPALALGGHLRLLGECTSGRAPAVGSGAAGVARLAGIGVAASQRWSPRRAVVRRVAEPGSRSGSPWRCRARSPTSTRTSELAWSTRAVRPAPAPG